MKTSKRASGGLIVYIRNDYVNKNTLVFQSHDDIICIKIESSKVNLTNDLYICLFYVVPESSSRQALLESHTLDRLLEFIIDLDSKNVNGFNLIVCGDMNAHTSNLQDFVQHEDCKHIDFLPDDYIPDDCKLRCSKDIGRLNSNGMCLLDLCKQTGLRILNGRVGSDVEGNYTYVGKSGSSVVDYV